MKLGLVAWLKKSDEFSNSYPTERINHPNQAILESESEMSVGKIQFSGTPPCVMFCGEYKNPQVSSQGCTIWAIETQSLKP